MEKVQRVCVCGNTLFHPVMEYGNEDARELPLTVELNDVRALHCAVCGLLNEFNVELKTWTTFAWDGKEWSAWPKQ